MSISNLGALIHVDPDAAKGRILKAIEQSKGDRKAAAEALGTTHRSFYRFVERLKLWPDIDRLMRDKEFAKVPGPPRTAKRIRDALLANEGDLARAAKQLGYKTDGLVERIGELDLWDPLNRVLRAGGLPTLERPAAKAS